MFDQLYINSGLEDTKFIIADQPAKCASGAHGMECQKRKSHQNGGFGFFFEVWFALSPFDSAVGRATKEKKSI